MKPSHIIELIIGVATLGIIVSFFMFPGKIDYINNYALIPIFAGIVTSIIAIISQEKYRFYKNFNALCSEIEQNHLRMSDQVILKQLSRMRRIHEESLSDPNHIEWVGFEKEILVWVINQDPNPTNADHYRYLPNNELKNFINNGLMSKLTKSTVDKLILFYLSCDEYSLKIQNMEKEIFLNRKRFFDDTTFHTDDEMNRNLNLWMSSSQNPPDNKRTGDNDQSTERPFKSFVPRRQFSI
ncbi:MAG: hypothetical protein ABFC38_04265 [Methanospirillum sp.]